MTTALITIGVMSLIQIAALILFILVLIKQFRHGGALNGIIGLVTCGFWTFIWGWIKHRGLELTKVMVVWTVLIVAPLIVVAVFGFAMVNEGMALVTSLTAGGSLDKAVGSVDKKLVKKTSTADMGKAKKLTKLPKTDAKKHDDTSNGDWSQKAMALWENGKYSDPLKAIDYWDNSIQHDPKSAEAYNNRGLAFSNAKQYQRAIKDYSQAIRLSPQDALAFNNRGNTYYEMGQYELAEADYNTSIRLKPDYAKPYLNRGLIHYQQEKNGQACIDFKKACDLGDCEGQQWASQNNVCP